MLTVAEESQALLEEKRSRFIAVLMPQADFAAGLARCRAAHPKANHHVYAQRYFDAERRLVERSKDDGEPSGTAGPPILKVLQGRDLVEVACVVVRYFGGVKLGTGGLVRAYGGAAARAVAAATPVTFRHHRQAILFADFAAIGDLERLCNDYAIGILDRDFTDRGCRLRVCGPDAMIDDLVARYPHR